MNLVLDIGGSSTKYKIFDQKQKCLYSDNVQYGQLINAMAIQKIVEGIYLTTKEKYPISNIAISSLGIIDSATGQISGLGGIANYNSINWKVFFSQYKVPVFIENDANCAALYELLLNPEINNALVLTTGTGVGGAIIIDHKLFKGSHNAAGEFGVGLSHYDNEHYMNISSQASTHSIGQRYTKLSNHSTSVEEIMSLYDSSHDAKNSVDASVHYLAKAIINQALAIDPDIVYIGGGISKNKKFMSLLNHEIIRIMRDSEQPKLFKVAACHGGNDANLYGALSLIK